MNTGNDLNNWLAAEKSRINETLKAYELERTEVLGQLDDLGVVERTLSRLRLDRASLPKRRERAVVAEPPKLRRRRRRNGAAAALAPPMDGGPVCHSP